jgi:endoglucanase
MRFFVLMGAGPLRLRRACGRVAVMAVMGAVTATLGASSAWAGTANAGLPGVGSDPISGMVWGVPHNDDLWNDYQSLTGASHTLLGRLALKPRAVWLGYWDPTAQVQADTAATVTATQNGNPNALTEFATFELNPWENKGKAVHGSWNVSADEAWYRDMAAGIGSSRALVIEQVDLPFALSNSSTAPERIDTYAARVLSANPYTTVYIDGGTHGWLTATQDAALLIANGIRYARGFALNDTDYDPTQVEDRYGANVVTALAKMGVPGKHFIVDTDENGQPYRPYQVPGKKTKINDTPMCHGKIQTACQRTGILPTTNVASPKWNLSRPAMIAAERYCDGYVWSGRPWNKDAGPFQPRNALWLAGNGEY